MARISSDPIANYRGRIGKISYYIRECENMARKSSSAGKISDSPAAVAQRTKFGRLIKLSRELAPAITLGRRYANRGLRTAAMCTRIAHGTGHHRHVQHFDFKNHVWEHGYGRPRLLQCGRQDVWSAGEHPRGRMPGDSSRRTRRKRLDKRHSSCKMGKRTRNSVRFRHEREQEDGFAICLYHTDRRGLTRRQGGPPLSCI